MEQSKELPHEYSGHSMAERLVMFRDTLAPHEIQQRLERELMVLFSPQVVDGKLTMNAWAKVVGADYRFHLTFEAAETEQNFYSLRIEAKWEARNAENHEYYQKTFGSWCDLWTRDLRAVDSFVHVVNSEVLYRDRCEQSRVADESLSSTQSIQQAIITAMKQGATFRTAHKEGGTNIHWNYGKFIRSDYGEYPATEEYENEQVFFAKLFQFFQWDVTRHAPPNSVSEIDAWRLILRMIRS